MNVRVMILSLLIIAACTSEKKRAYEQVAREANSIFTALKPAAARIMSPKSDDLEIIEACKSAEDELWKLRDMRFEDAIIDPGDNLPIVFYAGQLLDYRHRMCREADGDRTRILGCSDWCMDVWISLIHTVERVRMGATHEGVDIVSLMPGSVR